MYILLYSMSSCHSISNYAFLSLQKCKFYPLVKTEYNKNSNLYDENKCLIYSDIV